MESFVIKTPCSSANIGPGFDVIGLALSVYLELHVTIDRTKTTSEHPLNCRITYEGQGEDSGDISLDPQSNLITRVALYVLRCHDQRAFPVETHVHIKNPIPLGRGLGSSGAAVVAGVFLGKEAGQLHHLNNNRLFDYCLMIGMCFRDHLDPFCCANLRVQSDTPTTLALRSLEASSEPISCH
jgi:homoserine kinase